MQSQTSQEPLFTKENISALIKKGKKAGYTGLSVFYTWRLIKKALTFGGKYMAKMFITLGKFLLGLTWYFIGAVVVAVFVEIVKRHIFSELDKDEAKAAKFATVKILSCSVIAALMSWWVLACLFKSNATAFIGGDAFVPFYGMAFYLLQMYLDLGIVKKMWTGIKTWIASRPKKVKMKKVVTYVAEDSETN